MPLRPRHGEKAWDIDLLGDLFGLFIRPVNQANLWRAEREQRAQNSAARPACADDKDRSVLQAVYAYLRNERRSKTFKIRIMRDQLTARFIKTIGDPQFFRFFRRNIGCFKGG